LMPNVLSLLEKRNKMHECDHVQVHISVSSTPTKIVLAEENDRVKVSYDAECGNGSASPARDVPRPFFFAVATARRAERSTRPSIRSQASLLLPARRPRPAVHWSLEVEIPILRPAGPRLVPLSPLVR
jgi:hypothetical protein